MKTDSLSIRRVRVWDGNALSDERDLFVEHGRIVENSVGDSLEIDGKFCLLLPGLTDLGLKIPDPGPEDFFTAVEGAAAMLRGGFVRALVEPDCDPVVDLLPAWIARNDNLTGHGVDFSPMAALSRRLEGNLLCDAGLLSEKGAVAFSDGGHPHNDPAFLRAFMEWSRLCGKRIFLRPLDVDLSGKALVHEGPVADSLGMRGIPVAAESLAVFRILRLAELTKARLHLRSLSCIECVDLVGDFRKKGVDVTCDVPVLNLCADDQVLLEHDSRWNVQPPLRDFGERKNLLQRALAGDVDALSPNHVPVLPRDKDDHFEAAAPGALGLETALAALNTFAVRPATAEDDFLALAKLLCFGADKVMGQKTDFLFGENPDFLLWNPETSWKVEADLFPGRAKNSPFLGEELQGRVEGTFASGFWHDFRKENV